MAQENANETKTTNKIHNLNEDSTSSGLILLTMGMCCYWEAFVATPSIRTGAYGSHRQHI